MIIEQRILKGRHRRLMLLSLLAMASLGSAAAKSDHAQNDPAYSAELPSRSVSASRLAAEVSEIANSTTLSRAKKEKRIATAVRVAVVAATVYKKDPEEILTIALDLAEAGTRAAPHFAEVIATSISFATPVVRIDAAPGQIRAAAFAAAKGPKAPRVARIARTVPEEVSEPPAEAEKVERNSAVVENRRARRPEVSAEPSDADTLVEQPMPSRSGPSSAPKISLGDNSSVVFTANVSVQHDDNVFLNTSDKVTLVKGQLVSPDKVSDTITAVTPGVEFRFGQNSLAHGSLDYQEAFTRYANHSSPNVNLGVGSAEFGYDSGKVAVDGTANYQQINQNSNAVAGVGSANATYRRDVLNVDSGVESHFTEKTSARIGANISQTEYKTSGLLGSKSVSWPANFFYETTPKLALSAGLTYTTVTPETAPNSSTTQTAVVSAKSRDLYYNVGLRGDISPKLSGNFSAGYRTRQVGDNPKENLLGLDGSFTYEVTPKTSLALALSRNFSVGVQGESLKSGTYSLNLTSDPSPQWQFGAGLSYRTDDYGPTEFSSSGRSRSSLNLRQDSYWESNLFVTYIFNSWLSTSAGGTFRNNHSTLLGDSFTDDLFSLTLSFRY